MNKYLTLLTIIFVLFSCSNGNQIPQKHNVSETRIGIPFSVSHEKRVIELDEPKLTGGTGLVVLDIFLDFNGKKTGFYIVYFQVFDKEGLEIKKYYKFSETPLPAIKYPMIIQNHFSFIQSYVDTIKIIKVNESLKSEKYRISIPIELVFR